MILIQENRCFLYEGPLQNEERLCRYHGGKNLSYLNCFRTFWHCSNTQLNTACFIQQPSGEWSLKVLQCGVEAQCLMDVETTVMPIFDDFLNISSLVEEYAFKLENKLKFESLSNREIEILKLLSEGKHNPEIAEVLKISEDTVKQHRKNIKKKLGVKTRADLHYFAKAFNL